MSTPAQGSDAARRVVVTGLGVVSPIGCGTEPFWQAAQRGAVGTSRLTQFDTAGLDTDQGGEVRDFEAPDYLKCVDSGELTRSGQFAVAVTRMALEDAGLVEAVTGSDRCGVCFGLVMGSRPSVEPVVRSVMDPSAAKREEPLAWLDPQQVSRAPAREFSLGGPNVAIPTACAAGNSAIAYAAEMIRLGRADVMVAGGADELSHAMYMMFSRFQALTPDVVRPFDVNRKGILMSEGAGAVVLESYEYARRRQAQLYGEVAGDANCADAHHMTHPHPDGRGASQAMRGALARAGVDPADVDFISAHGTGTTHNDVTESKAIREVFGAETDRIPVTSIKAMIGHTQGAASAIEAVLCFLAMRDGIIPPTVNLIEQDPECPVHLVAHEPRTHPVRVALNNGFGFGGNICCLVLRGPEESPATT